MVYYIVAILIIIGHLAKRVAYAADFQGKVGNLAYNISTVTFTVAAVIAIWNMVSNYLLPSAGPAPEINRLLPISIIAFVIYDQVYSFKAQKKLKGRKEDAMSKEDSWRQKTGSSKLDGPVRFLRHSGAVLCCFLSIAIPLFLPFLSAFPRRLGYTSFLCLQILQQKVLFWEWDAGDTWPVAAESFQQ